VSKGRLEAFSDGVIAVAITLLALNLIVPGPGHGPLLDQLGDRWPSFVAYLISFLTVGIIWVNHHQLVQNIAAIDRTLLFLNLLLLLFVVLIPFATATMADYLTDGGRDGQIAMALYAGVFEAMSLAFGAIFAWTLREGHTYHPIPREARRGVFLRFTAGGFPYLVAIGLAFVAPALSLVLIGLVAVYYVFEWTQE
jgi:uncharacterized membrane protein